ncbi:DUF1294 domain-containing protein [Qipengyuania sp. SS22]|uniref:DUF1294 domain-containing protein n=1 Tax=Qipengyuania sp. SS22 TaxID=2979461 RepID=UPI0021E5A733|nr:DUF1294 domain-containing protein [Qipengyuania sp. SS22]UYH54772.1 DUF1294 domain-containing protein [Qipengyuania sp. SS22]
MSKLQVIELATYYLIAVNFLTFVAFGYDKMQAERGGWRVAEATLVFFVIIGGIVGALAGRALFRHKIRKSSFTAKLGGGVLLNLCIVGGLVALASGRSPEEQARLDAQMDSVYYSGCNAVRRAGKAPLYYGEPGYRSDMDGDGDGIACEPRF